MQSVSKKETIVSLFLSIFLLWHIYHIIVTSIGNNRRENALEQEIEKLLKDDDVTKQAGIIPYLLSERTKHDEKYLSIRAFSESQKRRAYEKQAHKCPMCVKQGIDTEYAFEEMEGDHIIPWSQGGRTVDDNLQMLCKKCNNDKRDI